VDRQTVELTALAFQTLVTALLALVYYGLWRRRGRPYDGSWAVAWTMYVLRLGFISAYIHTRHEFWLFLHQLATGGTALLLLYAALQFSRSLRWREAYLWFIGFIVAESWVLVFGLHNFMLGGLSSSLLLSAVTLWTGVVFWRYRRRQPSGGATLLAWTFTLWGLHHLDYPLLRPLGTGVLFGVFADVLFIAATAVGALFLVVASDRRVLESRSAQLEQLTRLLLTAQEDERRRIARELHDEAGQVLTAVKIDLDLKGLREQGELVGRALGQVRDLSNLLRPTALDDLGLLPALRAMMEDFGMRTRIHTEFESHGELPSLTPDQKVAVYRVVQEALTNVARHAGASRVAVRIAHDDGSIDLRIHDNGRGPEGRVTPNLGLLGMQERVTALGGRIEVGRDTAGGFRIDVRIPAVVPA